MEKKYCLVVGDGNFSFSLALAKKNEDSESFQLVATSLQSFDEVAADPLAEENVSELKKKGAIVIHCVDGTQLANCDELVAIGLKYDITVFNFPHTGGKGNINENRKLLHKFFVSAVTLLKSCGEVRVTLCKGQGGTEVDCTRRGYDNSWKVVEMAAEAGLILTKVEPFKPESFHGYCPTGYRGQSKGFLLEGALSHVFTLPLPSPDSWCRAEDHGYKFCEFCCGDVPVSSESIASSLSEYSVFMQHPVLSQPWHPVVQIEEMLRENLRQQSTHLWKTVEGSLCKEILLHQSPSNCVPDERDVNVKIPSTVYAFTGRPSRGCAVKTVVNKPHDHSVALLCHPSSELHVPALGKALLLQDPGSPILKTVCNPILRNPPVSLCSTEQPICHELLGILSLNHYLQLDDSFHKECSELEAIMTKVVFSILTQSKRPIELAWCESKDGLCFHRCKQLKVTIDGSTLIIAELGFYSPALGGTFLSFMVSLEPLAMMYYGIEDVRLFWSKDSRLATQFKVENTRDVIFKPFSLYPPSYTHDISFWYRNAATSEGREPSSTDFDERPLKSIVRRIAKNCVAYLQCIDVYRPPGVSDVNSYCYRLIYSSADQALSRIMSNELQLRIREAVRREMAVELR